MQDATLPPVAHAWVSPDGTIHDVDDEQLYEFCKSRQLHYPNMLDHKQNPESDHKNGGWRLIERLRFIGHIHRPNEHIPALGTFDAFYNECLRSKDGRHVLTDKSTLSKLLNGTYQGGKPYKKVWQTRYLSVTEKRKALLERSGAVAQEQPVQLNIDFATFCRSPGIVAGVDEGAGVERADARLSGTARAHEVSLGAIVISFASCIAQHFKRHANPTPFKLTVTF